MAFCCTETQRNNKDLSSRITTCSITMYRDHAYSLLQFRTGACALAVWFLTTLNDLSGAPVTPANLASSSNLIWLDQGWSARQSEWFYSTSQGSQFMPYAYYIALEQADNQRLFNEPENLLRFRCLLRAPDRSNPQGLPVGFVIDK